MAAGAWDEFISDCLEVDPTIVVGRDRLGRELHDGDKVLSFNIMADGETWALSGTKKGVPVVMRRKLFEGSVRIYIVTADGGRTGVTPEDKITGVELISPL